MIAAELAAYLAANIPLTRALGVEVLEVGPRGVELGAPLAPNRNHRQTAFGGSVSALAMLAGWGWLRSKLDDSATPPQLVIQRQAMEFLLPVDDAFRARCPDPPAADWQRFSRALAARGKGRLELAVQVSCRERLVARFSGTYVAIAASGAAPRGASLHSGRAGADHRGGGAR
jgi:thioesterase domain-containing protein